MGLCWGASPPGTEAPLGLHSALGPSRTEDTSRELSLKTRRFTLSGVEGRTCEPLSPAQPLALQRGTGSGSSDPGEWLRQLEMPDPLGCGPSRAPWAAGPSLTWVQQASSWRWAW